MLTGAALVRTARFIPKERYASRSAELTQRKIKCRFPLSLVNRIELHVAHDSHHHPSLVGKEIERQSFSNGVFIRPKKFRHRVTDQHRSRPAPRRALSAPRCLST